MFGYVCVNKDELKIRDYNIYQSCYCGLCRSLRQRHGLLAPVTLSYDMTFMVILLSGLYETPFEEGYHHCMVHGARKELTRQNAWSDYAADMTILLAYHDLRDDWIDDHKLSHKTAADLMKGSYQRVAAEYPAQAAAVETYMKKLAAVESANEQNLDLASGSTGELLAAIFARDDAVWGETLSKVGFYLGKFIYLMDAFEDIEQDRKKGSYNPLLSICGRDDFPAYIENSLVLMMADCCRAFEQLPILQNAEILRNILYAGVWIKYENVKKRREKVEDNV